MKPGISKRTSDKRNKLTGKEAYIPLPSWNDSPSKTRILDFIEKTTNETSDDYLDTEDRIVVFDNDGTLWTEYPFYTQFQFVVDRIKTLLPQHPDWKDKQPYKGIIEGDFKAALAGGLHTIEELIMVTHAGMTSSEFEQIVRDWINTARHPRFNLPYTECIYQPMLELLTYLRAKKFRTFIVSGGGVEFMRPWVQEAYGIPPEQVIGSSIKNRYEIRNEKPELVRLPEVNFIDDKEGKPVGIYQHIGRKPAAVFGNSDGDFQMLEWVTGENKLTLGVLIHHDDADREFAYDKNAIAGKLDKSLREAEKRNWVVVSMKNDWKEIF